MDQSKEKRLHSKTTEKDEEEEERQQLNESLVVVQTVEEQPTKQLMSKSVNESTDINASLQNCRLQTGLNEHCLCKIFRYLPVYSLIQLCKLSYYFQDVINNGVISTKLVNFTDLHLLSCWKAEKIFQVFGRSLRRIKFSDENHLLHDSRFFLKMVTRYCKVDSLTELDLKFREYTCSEQLLNNALPYFTNIKNLCVENISDYPHIVAAICEVATNLSILKLKGAFFDGNWFKTAAMVNLTQLRLRQPKMFMSPGLLKQFFQNKPKLESFSYIGPKDIREIGELLADHCPTITTFEDVHLDYPYTYLSSIGNMIHHSSFVARFPNLRRVSLTSYTKCSYDLYELLVKLATQNRIEELKVYVDVMKAVSLDASVRLNMKPHSFDNFTSLKTVIIEIPRKDTPKQKRDEVFDFKSELLTKIISETRTVNRVSLICHQECSNFNTLLELAPHIQMFGISRVSVKNLPWEMRKVFRSIKRNCDEHDQRKLVHVIANILQWRELDVYKKYGVMTTEVDECRSFYY